MGEEMPSAQVVPVPNPVRLNAREEVMKTIMEMRAWRKE